MSEGAEFTVRLVDQVMGPAKSIQKNMRDVNKSFDVVKRALDAPASKRGALSDWDKMLSKAKLSQASDFAKQNARLVSAQKKVAPTDSGGGAGLLGGIAALMPEVAVVLAAAAAYALVAKEVIGLAYDFGAAALEAARFGEKSTLAIGFLTNNAAHAGTVFNDVRHEAQALGLDVQDTVGGFQKLLAAQFTVGQAKGLIKMGADMQAIGASAEEVQRIIYAMSEIKSIGTLQKRQERMLQMAGISGQLIDRALMKRTGIKTEGGLQLARKKNLIGADVAIEAIKDAVMAKTHEKALGDTGKAFATGTLAGMQSQLSAGMENFWIDVGQKMLPGATRVAKLVAGTIGKLANDPQLAALGEFMLAKFEALTVWVQTNWPQIEGVIVGGLHATADAMRFVVEVFDAGSTAFGIVSGAAFGFAQSVSFVSTSLVAIPRAVVSAISSMVVEFDNWLARIVGNWSQAGRDMMSGLVNGILSGLGPLGAAMATVLALTGMPGGKTPAMVPIPGMAQPYTELRPDMPGGPQGLPASGGIGGALLALSGAGDGKTEGGHPAGGAAVHIGEMPIHVTAAAGDDPNVTGAKIGAAVRAEFQKIMETHG